MSEPASDDALPQRSADDNDLGWGDEAREEPPEEQDARYAEDRPPHWEP